MKKHLLAGAIVALGLPTLASAVCVAPTSPDTLLAGQKWAYRLVNPADDATNYPGASIGAIGTFTGYAGGWLNVMETRNSAGYVTRMANLWGRWTGNSDCTGGTLRWSLYGQTFWLNFTLGAGGTMTISTDAGTTKPEALQGQARLNPPMACPAANAANPLTVLNGTTWDYRLRGANLAETGNFTASLWSPFAWSGNLQLSRTILSQPMPSVIADIPWAGGRYLVYGDCSGGELLFNTNGYVRQLDFVFSKADFREMYLIEDGYGNPLVTGFAGRR